MRSNVAIVVGDALTNVVDAWWHIWRFHLSELSTSGNLLKRINDILQSQSTNSTTAAVAAVAVAAAVAAAAAAAAVVAVVAVKSTTIAPSVHTSLVVLNMMVCQMSEPLKQILFNKGCYNYKVSCAMNSALLLLVISNPPLIASSTTRRLAQAAATTAAATLREAAELCKCVL